MKRFPLLISIAAAVIWLLPVVGPFADPAGASVITTGDVDPGGSGTQPDLWAVGGNLKVGETGSDTLNIEVGGEVFNTKGYIRSLFRLNGGSDGHRIRFAVEQLNLPSCRCRWRR